jgi:hypothetical protein
MPEGASLVGIQFRNNLTLPGSVMLTGGGNFDLAFVRVEWDGTIGFVRQVGGTGFASLGGIAARRDGGFVAAGSFATEATFAPGVMGDITLTADAGAGSDMFVAFYDRFARVERVLQVGGPNTQAPGGVAIAPDDEVVVAGNLLGEGTFGEPPSQTTLTPTGDLGDGFVARYLHNGMLRWAKRIAGGAAISVNAVTALADGSAVLTGQFKGTITLAPGEPEETMLTFQNFEDILVARYSQDGKLLDARREGGSISDTGRALASAADGTVYLAGTFEGDVTFGAGESGATSLSSAGSGDVVLVELRGRNFHTLEIRPEGVAYAKQANSTQRAEGNGLAVAGDLAVSTGFFITNAAFGSQMLTGQGTNPHLYVVAHQRDGNALWARSAGGMNGSITGKGIARVPASDGDDVVVTGIFSQGDVSFGMDTGGRSVVLTPSSFDIFVARYRASDGALRWAKGFGGTGFDQGFAAAGRLDGKTVIVGQFQGTMTLGSTTLTSDGGFDNFFALLDADGNAVAARKAGGTGFDQALGVAPFPDGGVAVTGSVVGMGKFGAMEANETSYDTGGRAHTFVARLGPNLDLQWVRFAGAMTANSAGIAAAVLPGGTVAVTGSFSDTATFGAGEGTEVTLNAPGTENAFVAFYDGGGAFEGAKQVVSSGINQGRAITALPNGGVLVTGFFNGSATFGSGEPNETTLTAAGGKNCFFASLDFARSLVFVTSAGSAGDTKGEAITAFPDGSFAATGLFTGTTVFGDGEANEKMLTAQTPSLLADAWVLGNFGY